MPESIIMARPLKKGLDYFPMDTKLDLKLQLIKAKYKLEGIGFIDMLYRIIYNEGYYITIDADNITMISADFGIEESRFNELLEFCINKDFFHKGLWESDKILTSTGIQKRYFHKTMRRSEQKYKFLLINPDTNEVIANKNSVNVNKKYTNKIKENKIKEEEIKDPTNLTMHLPKESPFSNLDTFLKEADEDPELKRINADLEFYHAYWISACTASNKSAYNWFQEIKRYIFSQERKDNFRTKKKNVIELSGR